MEPLATVILAAGQGKRMRSDLAKVLHRVCGRPMLTYVIRAARQAGSNRVILVVGHQRHHVVQTFQAEDVEFVVQEKQLGTAHALARTQQALSGYDGDLLVLAGDTPLLTGQTIRRLVDIHRAKEARATVLTAIVEQPSGYGRILRTADHMLDAIVEEKDATAEQKLIREINTGAYCFQAPLIFDILDRIDQDNRQGEYYLPDAIAILRRQRQPVAAAVAEDYREVLGVNSLDQLREAEEIMIARDAKS